VGLHGHGRIASLFRRLVRLAYILTDDSVPILVSVLAARFRVSSGYNVWVEGFPCSASHVPPIRGDVSKPY
jgi:hypothetical protein